MKKVFNILIADRNPHVREFIKREMMAEGYQVRLAENGRQLIKSIYRHEELHLLIMDPDLPDIDMPSLIKKLNDRVPFLPVVVHTFISDSAEYAELLREFPLVEKGGSSIESLKKIVSHIAHYQYPKETMPEMNCRNQRLER